MSDRPPSTEIIPDGPVTYSVVTGGSRKGGRMLLSSDGFTYTVKREKPGFIYWWCSSRRKGHHCAAKVKQYNDDFFQDAANHNHAADPTKAGKVTAFSLVKTKAAATVFRPAGSIVKETLREMAAVSQHARAKPANLIRVVNRHRQAMRPHDPMPDEIMFKINREYIDADNFLIDDVQLDGARHLMFATEEQLYHLQRAKRWFLDGTFKVVSRPFYQLMSVHAFLKKDACIKQLPLLFVLMSRRQKRDYVAVFQALLRRLDPDVPSVEWIMLDFEAAAWQALRDVFPRVILRGCVFHWTQCVYRMVLRLGLSATYLAAGDTYAFIRKLLALPFLPAEHITGAFRELETLSVQGGNDAVDRLVAYVGDTWVNGRTWRPNDWSVFRESVRTNNDLEGYHRGINGRANRASLPFYVMVPLLRDEARDVTIAARLVSESMVTRNQQETYKNTHGRILALWDSYENDESFTTSRLLREASYLTGTGPLPLADDRPDDK